MDIISPITGAIGLAGGIYGGIKAGKMRNKMNSYLNAQDAENKSWYDANALSDYAQRTDSMNLMRQLRENLARQNKASANISTITGATPEQQAAQKELSNKAVADTFSNIAALGQNWKDNITNKYLARKNMLAQQRIGMMEGDANSYENLMGNGLNLAAGSLGSILSGLQKKTTKI